MTPARTRELIGEHAQLRAAAFKAASDRVLPWLSLERMQAHQKVASHATATIHPVLLKHFGEP